MDHDHCSRRRGFTSASSRVDGADYNEGVRLFTNPWGNQLFGAAFFTITGLHLTHVTVGIVVLVIIALRHKSGKADAGDVEITGLYWHFVDLVWMFVVPLVYLLNVSR